MRTLTIKRGDFSLRNQGRSRLGRALSQARAACRQAFDRVDINRTRNQVKHLPIVSWLLAGRESTLAFREAVRKEATLRDRIFLPLFGAENQRRRIFRRLYLPAAKPEDIRIYTRVEKLGVPAVIALLVFAFASANASVGTTKLGPDVGLITTVIITLQEEAASAGPSNWLSGKAELMGSRESVMGASNYAKQAGYTFAANKTERDQLIADGTLVRLESKYIRLNNASSPYVLPVVARFIDRLGEQYVATGCGKLVVNGGMRPLDFQGTLKNGSSISVHPTGMATDLERIIPKSPVEKYCLAWLVSTLEKIERNKRADATKEDYNRHFHVVVVPHAYESFLARQPRIDPEVKLLATALYFETARNESMEGYRAIGWVIRNRMRSTKYPGTVVGVVADGAAGRTTGGCQFSFMCDGKVEHIETLCTKPDKLMEQYWLSDCEQKWEAAVKIAEQILAEPQSSDPTGGAVLYYAASMDKAPYWAATDMKPGTVRQIGSHMFGCSLHRGSDACRS